MSGISDPGKAGRGDRRRAQKLIDAAFAAGRLTAANRALRTDRVRSARTKGDLAVLVRDLDRPTDPVPAPTSTHAGLTAPADRTTPSLGSAIPPDHLLSMLKGSPERTMRMSDAMRSAVMVDKARDARRWVLISVALFVVACGLSIVFFVGSFVREVTQAVDPFDGDTSTTTKTADLHTAEGWSGLVDAVEGETGTSRVHDAVVYPEYASMDTVVADGAQRRSYRDGTLDEGFGGSSTPSSGATVDLADIDPDVLAGLPRATAKSLDIDDPDASYILINARSGRPTMTVYVQTLDGSARWVIYDLDGQAVGGSTV